jgi:hypothetical protein
VAVLPPSPPRLLSFAVGLAHSCLGERAILIRLFRRPNLPRLFGSDVFTRRRHPPQEGCRQSAFPA